MRTLEGSITLSNEDIGGSFDDRGFGFQEFLDSPLPARIVKEYCFFLQEQKAEVKHSEAEVLAVLRKLKYVQAISEEEYTMLQESILSPSFCGFYQTVIASKDGVSQIVFDGSVKSKPSLIQDRLDQVNENKEGLETVAKECYLKHLLKGKREEIEFEGKRYRRQKHAEQNYVLEFKQGYNSLEVWAPVGNSLESTFFYVKDGRFLGTGKVKEISEFEDILRLDIYFSGNERDAVNEQIVITTVAEPIFIPVGKYNYTFIETNKNFKGGIVLHTGDFIGDEVYLVDKSNEVKRIRTGKPDPEELRSSLRKRGERHISEVKYSSADNTIRVSYSYIELYRQGDFLPRLSGKQIDDEGHKSEFKDLQKPGNREEENGITYRTILDPQVEVIQL